MSGKTPIIGLSGAILAIAAQLFLSPMLTIGGATPNFLLSFFVPYSLLSSPNPKLFLGIVLGLVFDFTQGGPVGAYLLLFTVLSVAIPFFTSNLDRSNQGSQILAITLLIIATNILNIIFVSIATPAISLISLVQSGALWEVLFDCGIAILFYVILATFLKDKRTVPTMFGS